MDPRCARLRQDLPEGPSGRGEDLSAQLASRRHLADCAPCGEWIARAERRAALLRAVERAPAPAELDTLVAEALGAEGRGARVERVLRSLGRLPSPPAWARALEAVAAADEPGQGLQRAPSVLRRLVAEELADPAKARARRFLGSLQRLRSPAALERSVRQELARPPRRRRAGPWLLIGTSLAAAALLIGLRLQQPDEGARPTLRLEPLRSAAHLDPMGRLLLDSMSGGALSAESL